MSVHPERRRIISGIGRPRIGPRTQYRAIPRNHPFRMAYLLKLSRPEASFVPAMTLRCVLLQRLLVVCDDRQANRDELRRPQNESPHRQNSEHGRCCDSNDQQKIDGWVGQVDPAGRGGPVQRHEPEFPEIAGILKNVTPTTPLTERLFPGDDEISHLLRSTDWARTPLGPMETWSSVLIGYIRLILAMPTPAIIFWGPDQTQLYNAGYATIMGPRHPAYFGGTYRESWPETYPTIYPWMRRVLDAGEVIQVESEHIPLTRYGFNEEAYFSFTFSPVHDEHGRIQGIFQPVFEVTGNALAQRRAESLRSLETRSGSPGTIQGAVDALSSYQQDIPLVMFYVWNGTQEGLQLVGKSPTFNADSGPFDELAADVYEASAARRVGDAEQLFGGAHVGPWPEPAHAVFAVPVGNPERDSGRGVAIFGLSPRLHFDANYQAYLEQVSNQVMAQVALERERAARQQAAERQRQQLHELFMQAPAAIAVLWGPEHTFEMVNARYRQIIGERRDVIGQPIRKALPELEGQPFLEMLDSVYRSGEAYVGTEFRAMLERTEAGNEEELYFNFVYQPMRDSDGVTEGILVFAYNVTEQARSRQYAESLMAELKSEHKRKDEFLAMLAHELRNPLAVIHNAVQLCELSEEFRASTSSRYVDILRHQTRKLTAMVDDLLDVSRVTRGHITLKKEPLDVSRLLRNAVECGRSKLEEKRHDIELKLPEGEVRVIGDAVRLDQVFTNLIVNAGKYTDEGGHIAISLQRDGHTALLAVADTGIGLAAGTVDDIFKLFAQVDRDPDRSKGGLGIGLTVAKKVVELHDGEIEARSEGLGRGSEFRIRLPLAEDAPRSDDAVQVPVTLKKRRVLVVDDNLDAMETLAILLRFEGHDVTTAGSSEEALAIAAQQDFDAIFLDIGLPDMDGYEVAKRLRRQSRTATTRLAALTGYGQPGDLERSHAVGFDRHFVKPVDRVALFDFLGE